MKIACDLCAHLCEIADGARGRCGVRENRGGAIVTVNYGRVVALAVDPIEKKPLYHFLPGTATLSVALHGCNFTCSFCQNHEISQKETFSATAGYPLSPAELARQWETRPTPSVSFTYSEPLVWQDYLLDAAAILKPRGARIVMVTNGFFSDAALDRLLPVVDAFNIDVKGDDRFYRERCGGRLDPVLRGIERIAAAPGKVLEATTLVIEGAHTADDIVALGKRLAACGVQVWHLSAYHPAYRLSLPATSERFLLALCDRVRAEVLIPYVYAGNIRSSDGDHTRCAACDLLLITRRGFSVIDNLIRDDRCPSCHRPVYGLFEDPQSTRK